MTRHEMGHFNERAIGSRPFSLPKSVTISFCKTKSGRYRAHALDFDLVCTGTDRDETKRRIRLAVKTYIEYGLSNGWRNYILFPAPDECWQRLSSTETLIAIWDPIVIRDEQQDAQQRLLVYGAQRNENREAALQAV
jgi:hypothetical protein